MERLRIGAVLAGRYAVRNVMAVGPPPFARARGTIVRARKLLIPVQILLPVIGEPHGTTDASGIIGMLTQSALLAYALFPGGSYRAWPISVIHSLMEPL